MNKKNILILVVVIALAGLGLMMKKSKPQVVTPIVNTPAPSKEEPQQLIVGENPEGEADPSRMTLGMNKWKWISAVYNDGKKITPIKAGRFTLTFNKDGTFSATTDCNSMGGNYQTTGNGEIIFSKLMSTEMFCADSQEGEYQKILTNTSGYHFTSKGELILDLKFDSGSATFR